MFLVIFLSVATALPVGSAWAGTATTHPLVLSFDGSATPQGQFFSPQQLAVDETTGNLYLGSRKADGAFQGIVSVFDSSGAYLFQIDGSSTPQGGPLPIVRAIAVDNSGGPADGNVYVATGTAIDAQTGTSWITAFDSGGNYLYRLTGSDTPREAFESIGALQVDSAGNLIALEGEKGLDTPTNKGAVYKYSTTATSASYDSQLQVSGFASKLSFGADNTYLLTNTNSSGVQRLSSSGNLLETLPTNGSGRSVAFNPDSSSVFVGDGRNVIEFGPVGFVRVFGGMLIGASAVQVDRSLERIYVADHDAGTVLAFGPLASVSVPDVSIGPPVPTFFDAELSGAINPSGVPTSYYFEYKLHSAKAWAPMPVQDAGGGTENVPISVNLSGLRHSTEYDVRLIAVSNASGAIVRSPQHTFTTPTVPAPELSPATNITSDSATLSGEVIPFGVPVSWNFEYSSDHINWRSAPTSPEGGGSGTDAVPVSFDLSELEPNTTYFVRLTASYAGDSGGSAASIEKSFTTLAEPPVVSARDAFPVTDTEATLRAIVDPRKSPTTYYFEYGLDESYGGIAPVNQDGDAGSGLGGLPLFVDVSGLQPETTYHFRVVADNQVGPSVEGPDRTFTTTSSVDAVWPKRAIELVTPPDKGNQAASFLSIKQADLEGLLGEGNVPWGTVTGVPGSPNGLAASFLAERTSVGWISRSMVPLDFPGAIDRGWGPVKISPDGSAAIWRAEPSVWGHWPDLNVHLVREMGGKSTGLMQFDSDQINAGGLGQLDASNDLKYVPITTTLALDPSHDTNEALDLYDIGNGAPTLVGLLPGEEAAPPCGIYNGTLASDSYDTWVQESTVFFEAPASCGAPADLYVRDLVTGETTLISDPAEMGGALGGFLVRANADGSQAVFLSNGDIYLYEHGDGVNCLSCDGGVPSNAVDMGGGGRGVLVSEDLSHVYFISEQQLVPGQGEPPGSSDLTNLYSWHDGAVHFVSLYRGSLGLSNADVSEDGKTLLFELDGAGITPDLVEPVESNIYRYQESDGGPVECVSCVRPGAYRQHQFDSGNAVEGTLSGDGSTLAFQTDAGLLVRDINQARDIYEWRAGRLRLITNGVTEWPKRGEPDIESISKSGRDLIFSVAARLTGHELDGQVQIYDARVGGGFPPPAEPPARCVEDACQGPLDAGPRLASPSSANFYGAGNPAPERRTKRRQRQKGRAVCKSRADKASRQRKCVRKRDAKKMQLHIEQGGRG